MIRIETERDIECLRQVALLQQAEFTQLYARLATLTQELAHARGTDAVVIPAHDGGYVLVGASHPVPALFEGIPWGTPLVQEATRRVAREAGLLLAETAPWADVDVESDLYRIAAELAADPLRAPATASFLARLGLYSP